MEKASTTIKDYKKRIDESLNDIFLRKSLDKFAIEYKPNRDKVYAEIPSQDCIQTIAQTKDWCSQHSQELYETFKEQAQKRGLKVHYAKDAQEANELILKISNENTPQKTRQKVIKSKSMTAEESMLNHALLEAGFEVVESDLGEWIIQLRGEGPSHMVMPAIHLSRLQVAKDFSALTGEDYGKNFDDIDVQKLVKVARIALRKEFNQADIGVSGANFCVAENGAIVLATNEGNGRMVTTMPKKHIVLAGIDKLVPDVKTVLNALHVLPRNATAQRLTANVTWINNLDLQSPFTAQNQPTNSEKNSKERHIIFMDNGRSAMAKDPIFSQVFRCVRCGACANVCPVYRMVGGHKMGHIYIGAIGLILTYFFHGREKAHILSQNCIGCEACKNICAGGIDLPSLISEVRRRCQEEFGKPLSYSLASALLKNRKTFHAFLKAVRFAQKPFVQKNSQQSKDTHVDVRATDGFIRHLPHVLMGKHDYKSLPALAPKAFRELWQDLQYKLEKPTLRIAIFAGCLQDFVYPNQLQAFIGIMKSHNVQVEFCQEQSCCGLPLYMLNDTENAKEIALYNLESFQHYNNSQDTNSAYEFNKANSSAHKQENSSNPVDAIVTLCSSCASHLKNHYPKLLGTTAESFSHKVYDFSSFMVDVLGISSKTLQSLTAENTEKITFHAPCHQCRGLSVTEQPHRILKALGEYLPSKEEQVCCGFGGSYSAKFPEISAQILKKKIDNIKQSGADYLLTDCPGCIMQIKGALHKEQSPIQVMHMAEFYASKMKS